MIGAQHVRQDMAPEDSRRRGTRAHRAEDVLVLPHREHTPAHEPGEAGDRRDADRDRGVLERRSEHSDDHDRQEERREREHRVDEAHRGGFDEAARIAGDEADGHADDDADEDGEHAGHERLSAAVHEAA